MQFEKERYLKWIQESREFFNRSTRNLSEESSNFAPAPGMMTAAQQIGHVAHVIHWFLDGAFSPQGFDLDFEKQGRELQKVNSIAVARDAFEKAVHRALQEIAERPVTDWNSSIVPGPIMGGEARTAVLGGILDHTAHHRGALTVYTRLQGKVPPMPYADM